MARVAADHADVMVAQLGRIESQELALARQRYTDRTGRIRTTENVAEGLQPGDGGGGPRTADPHRTPTFRKRAKANCGVAHRHMVDVPADRSREGHEGERLPRDLGKLSHDRRRGAGSLRIRFDFAYVRISPERRVGERQNSPYDTGRRKEAQFLGVANRRYAPAREIEARPCPAAAPEHRDGGNRRPIGQPCQNAADREGEIVRVWRKAEDTHAHFRHSVAIVSRRQRAFYSVRSAAATIERPAPT